MFWPGFVESMILLLKSPFYISSSSVAENERWWSRDKTCSTRNPTGGIGHRHFGFLRLGFVGRRPHSAVDVFGSRSSSTLTESTSISQSILGRAVVYVLSVIMKVCRGMVLVILFGAGLLHGLPGYVLATPTQTSRVVHCGAGRTAESNKVSSPSRTCNMDSPIPRIVLQILRHPR